MPLDDDGFAMNGGPPALQLLAPPPLVEMPKLFDGCASQKEAISRMIDELSKPSAYQLDGFDVMYRRLADALILVLANQGGLMP